MGIIDSIGEIIGKTELVDSVNEIAGAALDSRTVIADTRELAKYSTLLASKLSPAFFKSSATSFNSEFSLYETIASRNIVDSA